MQNKTIRASSLSDFADCPRRMITRQYPDIISQVVAPRETPENIAAITGTAVHKAAETMLNDKRDTGSISISRSIDAGVSELNRQLADAAGNTAFDDTTRDQSTAEKQVKKMAGVYEPLARDIETEYTELHLTARLPGGWKSSGHIDVYGHGVPRDTKTGKMKSVHIFQAGNYLLLLKANKYTISDKTWIDFIRRVPVSKAQPPIESSFYNSDVAMKAAEIVIRRVMWTIEDFEKNGNIENIPANPMSMMCSDRYCPAHSTELCKYGKC